jgi:predicted restriction endonuclease
MQPVSHVRTPKDDFKPGDCFKNRIELSLSGMHRPRRAGIGGTVAEGAESIVLSGMYEDDVDLGDTVHYVGHGGRDAKTGRQVADQTLDRYNRALVRSAELERPIRLIRGASLGNEFAPAEGYRYEGLFKITQYVQERGKSGFWVWKFTFVRLKEA